MDPKSKYDKNRWGSYKNSKISDLLTAHGKGELEVGEFVEVNGYIQSIRKQKKKAFAAIRDGKSLDTLQAVMTPELAEG